MTKYLGQINADMADAKLAAIRYGEQKRDFALLNYQARTGADNLLGTVMPYEFWYTRSMLNWALRSIARPTTLLNWARLRALQEKYMEGEGSIPTRLKKKIKIQMPFLPDWMGGGAYVDPMKQLFPIEQLTRPWETLGEEKTLELRKAESALAQMVESEDITESQMQQALASRNGPIWERAIAQARNEADSQIKNPLDFAFMMSGPSLPISMAYSYMTGRQNGSAGCHHPLDPGQYSRVRAGWADWGQHRSRFTQSRRAARDGPVPGLPGRPHAIQPGCRREDHCR